MMRDAFRLPGSRTSRFLIACELIVGFQLVVAIVDTDVAPGLQGVRTGLVGLLTLATVGGTNLWTGPGPRSLRLLAGALALLLGTLGVGAGVAIGVAGLAVAGPSPLALLGVLALAAGLTVTVAAGVWLLGRCHAGGGRWVSRALSWSLSSGCCR